MRNAYLIAAGAGVVSAIAFLSALMGSPVTSSFLFLIAALPLYVAGIGWTWAAALLATSVGSLILVLVGAKDAGMVFAGVVGMPAILLTYLAEQRRAATDAAGVVTVRWASPGLLVVVSAVIASVLSAFLLMSLHENLPQVREEVGKLIRNTPQLSGDQQLNEQQIGQITDIFVAVLPAVAAIAAMMGSLLNLWLAGRAVLAAGQLQRPWPDLAAMRFPPGTPLLLAAAAIGSSTLTGLGGIAAAGVMGALFLAYLLLGLAVIHYVTRGKSWRPFALWGVYLGLLVVNVWVALPIIILGLLDAIFSLRRPAAGGTT